MGVRGKTIFTFILVIIIVGVFVLQKNNPALFKGQIKKNLNGNEITEHIDLVAKMKTLAPVEGSEDIRVSATVSNNGTTAIPKGKPFKYVIYINEAEVFSNTDSYSSVEPGDSFNFIYPISRAIYQYEDSGTVKFVVDSEDKISESNEENNSVEIEYSL